MLVGGLSSRSGTYSLRLPEAVQLLVLHTEDQGCQVQLQNVLEENDAQVRVRRQLSFRSTSDGDRLHPFTQRYRGDLNPSMDFSVQAKVENGE
jgi:hypothetical protein